MALLLRTKLGNAVHKMVIYMPDEEPLYNVLVRPQLEYAIQANCPYLKKDKHHLERIQRAATRWVAGLRDLNYEDRLNELK